MPTNWPPSPVLYSSLLVFLFRCSHTDPVIHRHYLHTYTKNSTGFCGKVEVNTKVIHRHYLHTYTKTALDSVGKSKWTQSFWGWIWWCHKLEIFFFWETFKLPLGSCISFEEWIGFQNRLVDAKRFWKMPYGNGGFKITNYFIQWQQTFMIMAY